MILQIRTKMDEEKFIILKLSVALVSMFTAILLINPQGLLITCAIASATSFLDYLEAADKFNPLSIRENVVRFALYTMAGVSLFSAFILFFFSTKDIANDISEITPYLLFDYSERFFQKERLYIAFSIGALIITLLNGASLLIIPKLRELLSRSKYDINKNVHRAISRMLSKS